jgi:Kef-type K+ transport system membrane component KefB
MIDVHTVWILLIGLTVIASGMIEASFARLRVPALVGYLVLGVILSVVDTRVELLTEAVRNGFSLLADIGVFALLFKVGLQSQPAALARKLPQAATVWVGDVCCSGMLGFGVSYYLLDLQMIPSLIVGTALTATSVGVSVAAWQGSGALGSDNGQLLLDVAELDDISAIALMALLFAVIPVLHQGHADTVPGLGYTGAAFIARFLLFIGFCYLLSRYFEPKITRFSARLEPPPQHMLTVIGIGLIIAAFANSLGFSLAIGALFAGLVFSGDPEAVKTEKSFTDIYAFFTPFFFVNIGLNVTPDYLISGAGLGTVLLLGAIAGKFIGAGMPALLTSSLTGATLIGVSMVPRAEIAMIVVHQSRQMGDWAMPEQIYAGMVFVSMMTCVAAPWILYRLLQRWPQVSNTSS